MSLLSKLLDKRGISKVEDLSPEEAVVYEKYRKVLIGDVVTVESLKEFCQVQIKLIEEKFSGQESDHDVYYKACLHVYLTLLKAIEAPEAERESLEKYLTQLVDS